MSFHSIATLTAVAIAVFAFAIAIYSQDATVKLESNSRTDDLTETEHVSTSDEFVASLIRTNAVDFPGERFLIRASEAELKLLGNHHHDGVALRANWELTFREAMLAAKPLPGDARVGYEYSVGVIDGEAITRFIAFLERRLKTKVPARWEEALRTADIYQSLDENSRRLFLKNKEHRDWERTGGFPGFERREDGTIRAKDELWADKPLPELDTTINCSDEITANAIGLTIAADAETGTQSGEFRINCTLLKEILDQLEAYEPYDEDDPTETTCGCSLIRQKRIAAEFKPIVANELVVVTGREYSQIKLFALNTSIESEGAFDSIKWQSKTDIDWLNGLQGELNYEFRLCEDRLVVFFYTSKTLGVTALRLANGRREFFFTPHANRDVDGGDDQGNEK